MGISDQRRQYLLDYHKEKIKRVPLDMPKAQYDRIKAAADAAGESVNGYIKKAVERQISQDLKQKKRG